jgi:hypothetical protein
MEGLGASRRLISLSPVLKPPAMPGMRRKSRAFVRRYQKFESILLQR